MATNLPVERASSGDLHARADWSKREQYKSENDQGMKDQRGEPHQEEDRQPEKLHYIQL